MTGGVEGDRSRHRAATDGRVLAVVGEVVAATHRDQQAPAVTLDSELEHDLGIFSLERVELAWRLEQAFRLRLTPDDVADAVSVGDLAAAVGGRIGRPADRPAPPRMRRREPVAPESHPRSALFTLYVGALLAVMAPAAWLLLVARPGGPRAGALLRRSARALVRAARCRLEVRGLEHLHGLSSCVLVANHESFVDSVVLQAALPLDLAIDVQIVVNERLPRAPLLGTAIRKARHVVVNRATVRTRLAGKDAMVAALRNGASLLVFPEATTAHGPALLPFRLGAFAAAADAGRPIVPIAIGGTRRLLPRGTWMLGRAPVRVAVLPPVQPGSSEWSALVRLRDEVKAQIEDARSAAWPA